MKMKKYILPLFLILAGVYAFAASDEKETDAIDEAAAKEKVEEALEMSDAQPLNEPEVIAPLNLFSEEMKESLDRETLDFIEEALAAKVVGEKNADFDKVKLTAGSIADLTKITPQTPCTINNQNSKQMTIEWNLDGKKVTVSVPLGYDTPKTGSRSDIENRLIAMLKAGESKRKSFGKIDPEKLESYGDSLYILPGKYYQDKSITRNVYFLNDSTLAPVWSVEYPLESVADMFLLPSAKYGDVKVKMTILKHEYGEQETVEVPLQQMMAAFEQDGCVPYWGVEKFDNGKLEGALFLYNQQQGYNHVLKVDCSPADLINGGGEITARASLYIPVNNVRNLYAPYKKKTEKEKIKYNKK